MKPTFREMMGILPTGIHPSKDGLVFDIYDEELLEYLEGEYLKNVSKLIDARPAKIPRLVHFIWLGPKPFPEESVINVLSWKKYNPEWQLIFWTDDKDRPCPIEGMQKRLVQEYDFKEMAPLIALSTNWGEKSDLMRYVIVSDMGGFYVDHDSEVVKSFEPLLSFDAVICCEEPAWRGGASDSHVLFQNGLFGFIAGHPILKQTRENIQKIWHELDVLYPDNGALTPSWKVLRRTFDCFTLAVKEQLITSKNTLILPTCYFFSNRILSPQDIERFYNEGVIWSHHKYAGLWADGAWGTIFE
ncbi:MAG: hypothetical protein LLF94_00760 [Chlamydiales bacterium]|nr:hypothetical protein [Chlamydiales bacterium]